VLALPHNIPQATNTVDVSSVTPRPGEWCA